MKKKYKRSAFAEAARSTAVKTTHNQRMIDLRKPRPRKAGELAERGDFYKHNGYLIHNV